jgi:CubicO group peptidase (beta-lactamase class C family)
VAVTGSLARVAETFATLHGPRDRGDEGGPAPGASFCVVRDGEMVLDLHGGAHDTDRSWGFDSLGAIASGTKGIAAVAAAMALERADVSLDAPMRLVWPEFEQAGKVGLTIADAMAHLGGVPGMPCEWSWDDVRTPGRMAARLAVETPLVPMRRPSYHAMTYGWIAGEVVRRVDGRTIGRFVREELAEPLGLDLHIGATPAAISRVARTVRAPDYALGAFAPGTTPDPRLARVYDERLYLVMGRPDHLDAEVPAANGVASARGMAGLYGALVDRRRGVRRLVTGETLRAAVRERSCGTDPLTGRLLRFGFGFEINPNPSFLGPSPDAFGHTGAGGSTHGAWPSRGVAWSYVIREYRPEFNDGRATRLLGALWRAL